MKTNPADYDYSNAQRGSALAPVLPSSAWLRQSTDGLDENEESSVVLPIGNAVPPNMPMTMDHSVRKMEDVGVDQGFCQRITDCVAFCLCRPKREHTD